MKTSGITLGPMETQFFAWAQARKKDEVKTGDLVDAMKITARQESSLLYNLSNSGLILQLWRGYYLVPTQIPPGGKWNPSPYLIINKYMHQLGAKYQISGPVAFNSYGFSTQLSSEFLIYNNLISKEVNLRQYRFIFVKVKKQRLGATKEFRPSGGSIKEKAIFSSLEQALLDAVYDYKRFGTLPEAYSWIAESLQNKTAKTKILSQIVCQYGNTMSKKRIGWLLEKLGVSQQILNSIRRQIPKSKYLVPLNPKNFEGPINKFWGVIENVQIPARK